MTVPGADALAAGLVGTVEQLDEPDSFFNEPACEHAILRVRRLQRIFDVISTVHLDDVIRF